MSSLKLSSTEPVNPETLIHVLADLFVSGARPDRRALASVCSRIPPGLSLPAILSAAHQEADERLTLFNPNRK